MEQYCVRQMAEPISWTVEVPGSKSITNRALLMAALSEGTVSLDGVLFSDDSRYFLKSLSSLGYHVQADEMSKRVIVEGNGGRLPHQTGEIYVGSAGTAARFLTAMLGVAEGCFTIQASAQMQKRPMQPLFEVLLKLGASIEWLGEKWHLPVRITGAGLTGAGQTTQQPVAFDLDISESTQFLSAFLLISPMFAGGLNIHIVSEKTDGSYIRITRRMMDTFGVAAGFDGTDYTVPAGAIYRRTQYQIEPDVSAACYFYGAAAICGGTAKVMHVHSDGLQGDLKFLDVLTRMGCEKTEEEDGIRITGPGPGRLAGIDLNMNDFSDQALTLAAIAPYAAGPVSIRQIGHIRGQESDRIHAIVSNLQAAGIVCEEYPDAVTIYPGVPGGCTIDTFEDHRVAMAFAIMGLRAAAPVVIDNPMCCRKTFEQFFDLLDHLTKDR